LSTLEQLGPSLGIDLSPDWNVLIIEDEPLMSALMSRYIGSLPAPMREQMQMGFLSSGWKLLTSDLSPIRVAVVDILLPQVTGVDLMKDFRRRYPGIGLVPVTGMATEPMKRNLREVLFEHERILEKPLRREDFLELFMGAWNLSDPKSIQPRSPERSPSKEAGLDSWSVAINSNPGITVEARRKLTRRKTAA